MTSDRWTRIESLFADALELPPADRAAFLERACNGDVGLHRELESLLASDAPESRLLNTPSLLPDSTMDACRIGPYRIIRKIGQGGAGSVYLGVRDDDQYQKHVAIKILKRGMDTDAMLTNFRQERQILANLEHPFIARLMDGGTTCTGLPYFVMEFVDGAPITTYCENKGLSTFEKLRLFRLVCEAVQYAHQNLVVHRDLKPSNILTAREGIPKLLDFGIAKVLAPDQQTAVDVAITRYEDRMLTPDYASPEQVKGVSINTASDVYSLGAVLYELLTGQRPHRFPSDSLADLEKTICEVEPIRPSLAVSQNERLEPKNRKQLKRELSGDLDNIVLTAMQKEPLRRYASAADLSEDLGRHMEALPVYAREDRLSYRVGKFILRNRLALAATGLLIATLIAGIITTTFQARRAERRFALSRDLARAVMAEVRGPMERLPSSTEARASMIQTMLKYLDGLAQDPGSDGGFELEIADTYREVASIEGYPFRQNLGQSAAALQHFDRAIGFYQRLSLQKNVRARAIGGLIATHLDVGDILLRQGRIAESRTRLQTAVELGARVSGDPTVASIPEETWVSLYARIGDRQVRDGNPKEALPNFEKSLAFAFRWFETDSSIAARRVLFAAYVRLAGPQLETGELFGARKNYEAALSLAEDGVRLPSATAYERSMVAGGNRVLSIVLGNPNALHFGDWLAALRLARRAVEVGEAVAARDSKDFRVRDGVAIANRSLAEILAEVNPAEAIPFFEKAVSMTRALSVAEPSNAKYRYDLAISQMFFAECLHKLGRDREALEKLRDVLEAMRALADLAPDQISLTSALGRVHRDIGDILLIQRDDAAALDAYEKALKLTNEAAQRAPSNLLLQRNHGDSIEQMGRYYLALSRQHPQLGGEARRWLRQSLQLWQGWKQANLAMPYAAMRERQTAALLASIGK